MLLPKMKIWIVLTVLASASLACSGVSLASSSIGNAVPNSQVLYQDDFSKSDSGWGTWKQDVSEVSYQSGGLRVLIKEPHYDYWSRPGKRFADARLEVDATRLSGPENNDFGLICRYRNSDNFYAFVSSSDGYYGIVLVKDGQYQVLGSEQLQYSSTIRKGNATNHLRGECIGNTLTFSINKKPLMQVEDSTFKSGEVGVMAGSYDKPGVDILFDNFIVMKP